MTPRELADCKQYLIGSIPRLLETNGAIATFLQTAEFFGLGLDHDLRLPALLDAVTLEDVNAAARQTLDANRASSRRSPALSEATMDRGCDATIDVALRSPTYARRPAQRSSREHVKMDVEDVWPASRFVLKTVRYPRTS